MVTGPQKLERNVCVSDADLPQQILSVVSRIRPFVLETPLVHSHALSERTGAEVFLKLENRQHTGSFKLRGAANKLYSLSAQERAHGVITASSGNHGLAVAHAAAQLDVPATIYLPKDASLRKLEKLRAFPANLSLVPGDALDAELSARRAATRGQTYISPYNDPQIIAGQGTIAIELLRQEPELYAVFATVGGGGLMGGIASYLNQTGRNIRTIGCQPERSAVMLASIRAGRIVAEENSLPTLSDGSAGGIEENAVTFDLCRRYVDRWLTASEEEIAQAMRLVYDDTGERIEGAAGVAVAGLLQQGKRLAGRRLAVVICGGNVEEKVWRQVMEAEI